MEIFIYEIVGALRGDVDSDVAKYYKDRIELKARTEAEAIKEAEELQALHDKEALKHCPEKLVIERAPCYLNRLYKVIDFAGDEILEQVIV